ncbi:protein FAR1-RELATED SEQUENCE 6-like [Syzygium oleosum]|uniref:protein FAR1-RELATED SEQUENCE 6-like n=1 Tax=Syzygium oleosum TaxID=219896 RepID=UPI0011D181C1|nr:protein FAR1-RELATED SEQUENCE 6-like [Syzygium oleosum]XP_056174800.1 protein FAR1-RELATED SEQUENCE 6-like [Syzygium oleosum]
MEEVHLNSEPLFDDGNEYEFEEDANAMDDGGEVSAARPKKGHSPPTVGLEFDSFDQAYDFYNMYGKEQGFGIRVSNSWFRSKRKERYRAKLSCSSAGFKKKSEANNPRPETRTGCPAMIVIRLVDSERWRIVEVQLEHNHKVSPEIKRFYKSHKKMIVAAKKAQPPSEPVTQMHIIKLYRPAAIDSGCNGYLSIGRDDGINSVDHAKHLELKEGDAHALYNYFCRMKLTNPNFFYLMDIDDDGRLRNVFWADARSRAEYAYFSDTVAVDSMCLASKFEIPLISFIGINHHGQSILLGCGFVGHESVEHYVWIFRAWLNCMLDHPPQVIFTDQSKAFQTAISEVFPNAHHCFCAWYIMQRVHEKLGGLKGYEVIKRQLKRSIFNSLKIAEFETSWAEMIHRHGLKDNKWLHSLYEDRQMWVPVYLKDTFFAGMILIQESESKSAFFDGYVHKHTSFKEFVDKYDLVLHRKHLKEAMAELESRNINCELKTRCNFEVQLSKVYTKEIFKRFQSEVEGMYSCFNTRQVNVDGAIITYIVKERVVNGTEKEVRNYEVLYETSQVDIRCICSLFNYKGYLCRHALNVLNYNGVEEIPRQYILSRWSKDCKRQPLEIPHGSNDLDVHNPAWWHNNLYRRAIPIVEEGARSKDHYKITLHELEELLNKLDLVEDNLNAPKNV